MSILGDKDNATALIGAVIKGHMETVQALLAAGADVNAKDNDGDFALMFAARNGHTETVQILLAAGAEVNAKNNNGDIALMYSVEKKQHRNGSSTPHCWRRCQY